MICKTCKMKNNYYHKYCFNCGSPMPAKEIQYRKVESKLNKQIPVIIMQKGHALEKIQKRRAKKRLQKAIVWITAILIIASVVTILLLN